MSDLILRSTTRAQLQTLELSARLVAFARRAAERLEREQTGQDMVEYAGVVFVVALIIAGAIASGIAGDIQTGIKNLVGDVLAGKKPAGAS